MRIPFSRPAIGEREIEYVTRVLRSGRLSLGPMLEAFESRIAGCVGRRYAVATNSGTSALHLMVQALGIGPEDEVLTTSFSFAASANCLLYERAVPVFVDIEPATLNLDPRELQDIVAHDYEWNPARRVLLNRCTGRALKAILPVHIFGAPCDLAPILDLARQYRLRVLEDACEALGAEYQGRPVGSFGDAAAFAFFPNKQITAGEGGMIVTDSAHIAQLCRSLRNQGRDDSSAWLRHARLGYNYRLSDLHGALGLAQLERLEELLDARARVASLYTQVLAGTPEIVLPRDPTTGKRSWFVYVIRVVAESCVQPRDCLMQRLLERGIDCRPYFTPIHRQPYFQKFRQSTQRALPHTDEAADQCLALPFFPDMTEAQVAEVCGAVREVLRALPARGEIAPVAGFAQGGPPIPQPLDQVR